MKMKERMLLYLVDRYPEVMSHLRADGAYLTDEGKKQIYAQCDGLYFAALYAYDHPKNPYYKNGETLGWCVKCWEFYYTLTKENGKTQIITYDQYWHDHYEEWCTLHWLSTIGLVGGCLEPERLARWRERCYAGCEGVYAHVKQELEDGSLADKLSRRGVANHYLWETVCAYRYGDVTGRRDITDNCVKVMEMVADGKHPAGTWLEGGSLVVGYSAVSYGAFAQFNDFTNNKYPKIAQTVKDAAVYILNTNYGVLGGHIAALDTRQRYSGSHAGGMSYQPGSLCGDAFMDQFISVNMARLENNPVKMTGQGLGFFMEFFLTMPESAETVPYDALKPDPDYKIGDMKARVMRRGKWVVPMCCHEQQTFNNRWILERCNLFSVYREGAGEIVGGGHSTSTPHLSCFEIIQNGVCEYLPKNTALLNNGMALEYNGARCTITFDITDNKVAVTYCIDGLLETAAAYVHIPLYVAMSDHVVVNGAEIKLINGEYASACLSLGHSLKHGGAHLTLNRDAILTYPENGFNPYLQVQKPNIGERYAVLTCALNYAVPEATLTIEAF